MLGRQCCVWQAVVVLWCLAGGGVVVMLGRWCCDAKHTTPSLLNRDNRRCCIHWYRKNVLEGQMEGKWAGEGKTLHVVRQHQDREKSVWKSEGIRISLQSTLCEDMALDDGVDITHSYKCNIVKTITRTTRIKTKQYWQSQAVILQVFSKVFFSKSFFKGVWKKKTPHKFCILLSISPTGVF